MELREGICPRCGDKNKILPRTNPLIENPICVKCAAASIDTTNIEHFGFLCRTLNIPANINQWMDALKRSPETVIEDYIEESVAANEYEDAVTDKWKEAQKEWDKVRTHNQLLNKIAPLRADFMRRMEVKWDPIYTFEQYLKLESLYSNIVKNLAIKNPAQLDTIKKYCKTSILLDDMIAGGEIKAINDATNALNRLGDLAQLQELSETANDSTIKTVADLYKYMEDHGFKFKYYDNVNRDIVDKTIKDIQQSLRTEVINATGLDVTLNQVRDNYYRDQEQEELETASTNLTLDELMNYADVNSYSDEDAAMDAELAAQALIIDED